MRNALFYLVVQTTVLLFCSKDIVHGFKYSSFNSIQLRFSSRISHSSAISLKSITEEKSSTVSIPEEPEQSKSNQLQEKNTLKVPSSSWRWPPSWPFPGEYLDLAVNFDKDKDFKLNLDLINVYLEHYRASTDESASLLVIATDQFLDKVELEQSNWAKVDLKSISKGTTTDKIAYESESFDNVIVLNGVEVMQSPREVYNEVFRVLKHGGKSFTCFANKANVDPEAGYTPTSMWTTMTDEQKIWIAGSYFHYSAVGGWEGIEGHDLLGATGNGTMIFEKKNNDNEKDQVAYTVQASKIVVPSLDDPEVMMSAENVSKAFNKLSLGFKNLTPEDRRFLSIRTGSKYYNSTDADQKTKIVEGFQKADQLYDVLKEVKEVVIPKPVKAMLCSFLGEEWTNSQVQREALKMSVGLMTPNDDFWLPVSKEIIELSPKEKIYVTADLVNAFGSEENKNKLSGFPALLSEVISTLKKRLPEETTERAIQLYSVDLCISDYLFDRSRDAVESQKRVLKFVETISVKVLTDATAG